MKNNTEQAVVISPYSFADANQLPSLTLSQRQLCDVEMILNGGFAPLTGFMNQADYESVLSKMTLADGSIWPMPITLDVDADFAKGLNPADEIALRDAEGLLIAVLTVGDIWQADKQYEAQSVFGTQDDSHPGVNYLYQHAKSMYVGGELTQISLPHHYDFTHLRFTPAQLRHIFKERGWNKIVAFQTRNPMHRAHHELTLRAAEQTGAKVLIHPVVGMTKPGDIE